MNDIKTKKFPVSIGGKGEFIIPALTNPPDSGFVGMKTGKSFELGAISYIGESIGVDDVLDKLRPAPGDISRASRILNSFLAQLQDLKVGNVVAVRYDSEGMPHLDKKSERPEKGKRRKLPR